MTLPFLKPFPEEMSPPFTRNVQLVLKQYSAASS